MATAAPGDRATDRVLEAGATERGRPSAPGDGSCTRPLRPCGTRRCAGLGQRGRDIRRVYLGLFSAHVGIVAAPAGYDICGGECGQAGGVTGPDRAVTVVGRDLRRPGQPAPGDGEGAQVQGVAGRVAVRQPAHVGDPGAAAGYLHDVRHVELVWRHLDRCRPACAVVGGEGQPADVVRGPVRVRALGVPGGVEVSSRIDADIAVDPPFG